MVHTHTPTNLYTQGYQCIHTVPARACVGNTDRQYVCSSMEVAAFHGPALWEGSFPMVKLLA